MQKSKLIKLLKSLNEEELKRLGRFIRSPFYGYNPNITLLYEYVRKYYPELNSSKLNREKVFAKLFPEEQFSWNKLKKLMTALSQLVEEFLITMELEQNDFQKRKWLNKALGRRQVYDAFDRGTTHLLEELEEGSNRNMDFFKEQLELLSDRYFHPKFNPYDKKDLSMERMGECLDSYFGLAKMRLGTEIMVRNRILGRNVEQRFLDSLRKEREKGWLSNNPTYELYQHLHSILEEAEGGDFENLNQLFFEKVHSLQRIDQQVLFFHSLNYIIRKVNQGNAEFSSKALEWYKLGLNQELLIEQGRMSETTFGNIVIFGCREKQFDWTKAFIEDWKQYLDPEILEDAFAFNMASWYFYQNEFEDTVSFLMSHSFSIPYQLKVRLTEIRAFFEQFLKDDSYYEVLIAKIQAFENFIKRNTFFSKNNLEPYLNCIRIIEKLTNKISKRERKHKIIEWLENKTRSRRVITKNWLFEKANSLK